MHICITYTYMIMCRCQKRSISWGIRLSTCLRFSGKPVVHMTIVQDPANPVPGHWNLQGWVSLFVVFNAGVTYFWPPVQWRCCTILCFFTKVWNLDHHVGMCKIICPLNWRVSCPKHFSCHCLLVRTQHTGEISEWPSEPTDHNWPMSPLLRTTSKSAKLRIAHFCRNAGRPNLAQRWSRSWLCFRGEFQHWHPKTWYRCLSAAGELEGSEHIYIYIYVIYIYIYCILYTYYIYTAVYIYRLYTYIYIYIVCIYIYCIYIYMYTVYIYTDLLLW